jgi:DNA helicase II / ATP-dependent DNA helicase PcrA
MAYYKRTNKQGSKQPTLPPTRRSLPWSPEQKAFFCAVQELTQGQNLGLEARAGTGKTTSALEACWILLERNPSARILFCAFNKSVALELGSKVPSGVNASTLHSHGYAAVRKFWGKRFPKLTIGDDVAKNFARAFLGDEEETLEDRQVYAEVVNLSKDRLAHTPEQVREVMDQFGKQPSSNPEAFAKSVSEALASMAKGPGQSRDGAPMISFTDMIWLPVVNGWAPETYNVVFIDESQDLSPAKAELAKSSVVKGGNIIYVGDPRQAIYSWAGADTDSFERLTSALDARILPLTYTRRCGKVIVGEAQGIVPDFHAFDDAHEGEISSAKYEDLVEKLRKGDAVVSRTNAPLVRLFFRLMKVNARNGQRVCLLGKEFGTRIASRIKTWRKKSGNAKSFNVSMLLEKNAEWCANERARIEGRGGNAEGVIDQAEAIAALCEELSSNVETPESVDEVIERCESFSDDMSPDAIVLSSTHKFKGLERKVVFMLTDTYMPKWSKNVKEEENLKYVCITRAINTLVYVSGTGK